MQLRDLGRDCLVKILLEVNNYQTYTDKDLEEAREKINEEYEKRKILKKTQIIRGILRQISQYSKNLTENLIDKIYFDLKATYLNIGFLNIPDCYIYLSHDYELFSPWINGNIPRDSDEVKFIRILHRIRLGDKNLINHIYCYLKNEETIFIYPIIQKECVYCGENNHLFSRYLNLVCFNCEINGINRKYGGYSGDI